MLRHLDRKIRLVYIYSSTDQYALADTQYKLLIGCDSLFTLNAAMFFT
jgi:hypothetical protein